MSVILIKGEQINLSKEDNLDISKPVVFGLGFSGKDSKEVYLDSYIAVVDSEGNPLEFIYFNKKSGTGIKHNGVDLSRSRNSDDPDETIKVNLTSLHPLADKLIFGLFIYSGADKLGDLDYTFVNITSSTGKIICRYDISTNFRNFKSVVVSYAVLENGDWIFHPIGEGSMDDYRKLKNKYNSKTPSTEIVSNKMWFPRIIDTIKGWLS